MKFSPSGATSIDLCAYDYARASSFRDRITVLCRPVERPFSGVAVSMHPATGPLGRILGRTGFEGAIRALAPDAVLVEQHTITAARLARRLPNVPVVLRRHGFCSPEHGRAGRLRRRLARVASIVAVSEAVRRDAVAEVGLPPERIVVIPNGIATAEWQPARARAEVIAFAGRLAPQKGVLEAVQACGQVLRRHPGWRAVFFFSDPDVHFEYRDKTLEALRELPKEQVLVGYARPREEVKDLLERAAIAMVPSTTPESFGLSALEALAGGAALVASRAGGLDEVLGPSSEEAAVALGEVSSMSIAAALERLIENPALRQAFAARGRRRAERCFQISRLAESLDGLLCNVAAEARERNRC